MSDVVLVALITGGVGVTGLAFNFWNSSQERRHRLELTKREQEERYRVGLYEKRLQVHQEAYKWLMDIIEPAMKANLSPGGDSGVLAPVASLYVEARRWWDASCLYLDDESRLQLIDFIEAVRDISEGGVQDNPSLTTMYRSTMHALEIGIGMKHLDVKEPKRSVG